MLIRKKFQILLKLNKAQLLLLPFAWILLGIMQIIILTMPFRMITRLFLKPRSKTYSQNKKLLAINISKSIAIMAKYTPWESKCLVQGLTVRLLLRIFSIPSIFYIGISYDKDNKFLSHAWVNFNDVTIIGGAKSFNHFKIIQQFEDK